VIWPVALGYFEGAHVVAAWCELRDDFRHFRLDRIAALQVLDASPPRPRRELLKRWREYIERRESPHCADGTADRN